MYDSEERTLGHSLTIHLQFFRRLGQGTYSLKQADGTVNAVKTVRIPFLAWKPIFSACDVNRTAIAIPRFLRSGIFYGQRSDVFRKRRRADGSCTTCRQPNFGAIRKEQRCRSQCHQAHLNYCSASYECPKVQSATRSIFYTKRQAFHRPATHPGLMALRVCRYVLQYRLPGRHRVRCSSL